MPNLQGACVSTCAVTGAALQMIVSASHASTSSSVAQGRKTTVQPSGARMACSGSTGAKVFFIGDDDAKAGHGASTAAGQAMVAARRLTARALSAAAATTRSTSASLCMALRPWCQAGLT